MRLFIVILLLAIQNILISQEEYRLFLINEISFDFSNKNLLSGTDQLYKLEENSDTLFIYNDYLKFYIIDKKIHSSYLGEYEGIYDIKIWRENNLSIIIYFLLDDKNIYYYFYRCFDCKI